MSTYNPPINTSFEGIITALNKNYTSNWNNYVIVYPSSTSNVDNRDEAQCLIDRSILGDTIEKNWCSEARNNEYFILSFPHFYITPTFYSFKSKTSELNYPRTWKVEGSNNKGKWTLLDQKEDYDGLNEKGKELTFPFTKIYPFRYFKFTQLLSNDMETYPNFCLREVEIFGSIVLKLPTVMNKHKCILKDAFLFIYIINIL